MPDLTKIATCCYCGTRAVLRLGGTTAHHELACRSCGARLHTLKPLKANTAPAPASFRTRVAPLAGSTTKGRHKPKKKKPKKRSRWLSKAWDLIEDAVEEVFD